MDEAATMTEHERKRELAHARTLLEDATLILDADENNVRESRENRDRAILHALAQGLTHQQVADATGLSRGRVGRIANAPAKDVKAETPHSYPPPHDEHQAYLLRRST